MEINGLLPILRRWLIVVLIATAMATVVGWRLAASAEETYEAKSLLLVGPLNTDNDTMRASSALSQTYAELATSDAVLNDVAETTGVGRSELKDGVRATANSATRFLTVRARAEDPEAARDVANAVAVGLVELGRQDALRPEGQLRVIDPATAPSSPTSSAGLIIPLAALAGLLGSATLVLIFEFAGDMAETGEKVSEAAGAPTLTVRRRSRWWPGSSPHADPLKVVATQVELVAPELRSVLVTSASEDDGTAAVALDLAALWAQRRDDLTVLDCTGDRIVVWGAPETDDAPSSEALTEVQARALIDRMAPGHHMVVVVARPPVVSTATLVWARASDVTLLGVRRFQARRTQVRDAASALRAARATVAFALLHDGGPRPESEPPWVPDPSSAGVPGRVATDEGPGRNGSRPPVAVTSTQDGGSR